MNDLISRQAAIDAADYTDYTGIAIEDVKKVTDEVVKELKKLPPVDAVPVIRCKDCKYAYITNDGECKYCDIWFPVVAKYLDGDYYCASAERKES